MNYRHAYHAGNFADCFKHSLLVRYSPHLSARRLPTSCWIRMRVPVATILQARWAHRTGEANTGIRRLLQVALSPRYGAISWT